LHRTKLYLFMQEDKTSDFLFCLKNKINSYKFARQGFINAKRLHPYQWICLVAPITAFVLALIMKISTIEWYFIIFAFSIMLHAELFSLYVEKVIIVLYNDFNRFTGKIRNKAVVTVLINHFYDRFI